MRKAVIVAVLLAGLPSLGQPLWGQSPSVGVKSGGQQKQQRKLTTSQAEADQRGTKNAPLVVDILSRPNSQAEAAEAKAEKDHKDFVDRWTLVLAALVAFFTGLLVIVGQRGVNAANETLKGIARQIDLQERSMEQWVVHKDWKALQPLDAGPGNYRIVIELQIENPTDRPVTLPSASIKFTVGKESTTFWFRDNCFLPPKIPHTVRTVFWANEKQYEQFLNCSFPIHVWGDVSHIGSLEKRREQIFTGILWCSKTRGSHFEEETPGVAPGDGSGGEYDGQRPN